MNTHLIPIFNGLISQEQTQLVNARELHFYLESKQDFSTWIKKRINEYGFIENKDFVRFHKKMEANNASIIDYHVTIGMAKELSMVERTEKGREARKYFIECEKRLINKLSNGMITSKISRPKRKPIKNRDHLSFTKRNEKGYMINWHVPSRENNWHECYGIGEIWFDEIVELARNNPKEALEAMMLAVPILAKNYPEAHSSGFYDQMARWALTAILEHKGDLSLPFKTDDLGIEPRESFNYYLNQ